MSMFGADVAELRALAAQFDQAADRLDRGRLEVGNGIRISAWAGPFAVAFRLRWDSEHSLRLASAARRLRQSAARSRANADEQEKASAVDRGLGAEARGYAPYPTPGDVRVARDETTQDDPPRGAWNPSEVIAEFDRDGTYRSGVSIRTILCADGTEAHIIYIPGTQDWLGNSDNVYNGVDNAAAALTLDTRASRAVLEAMRQHGIGPGDPVLLSGHSQGALIAGNLAADPAFRSNYRVEGVVAYGADIRARDIPAGVAVTQVVNKVDVVTNVTNLVGLNGIQNLNHVEFTHLGLRTEHEMDASFVGRFRNAGEALAKVMTAGIGEHLDNSAYGSAALGWYQSNAGEWDAEYASFKGGAGSTSTMTRYTFKE